MKRDRDMHVVAGIGAFLISAAMVATPLVYAGSGQPAETGPELDELEAIEASLAYKSATPPKQPQKKFQAPPEEAKPVGVSTDETKKPEPIKPEEPKPPAAKENLDDAFEKLKQQRQTDDPIGKPSDEEVGEFDGSKFGFAEVSTGDPWFQKLVADLHSGWEYPEILQDSGVPVGCVRLSAEGKIQDTLLRQKSDNSELNDSVERALTAVEKLRNQSPSPVPTHLLKAATTKWVCFKFQAKKE
jgi:TonB C terminal